MAEHKNGSAGRTSSKRAAQEAGDASSDAASDASEGVRSSGMFKHRKRDYLIGVRSAPGVVTASGDTIHDALSRMEDVQILRRLRRKGFQGLGATVLPVDQEIVVVRMSEQRAEALRQNAPPHVVVEQDARLVTGQAMNPVPFASPWSGREVPTPRRRQEIRFQILGEGDRPLPGAGITVFSRGFGAQAIADSSGTANVAIYDPETDLDDIGAVYVQPLADHWDCFVREPKLEANEANVARLRPLSQAAAKSAGEKRAAWGKRAMGLDRQAAGLSGAGVRIGLIDSGCDNSHALLRHVTRGVDLGHRDDRSKDWNRDEIGQGTHCAGIICARDPSPGVSGIAPEAEIHVFKLAPGGRFSDLIEALNQCIELQIDIVHIGVGSQQGSELVAHKIMEARFKGIACITAAGDSGGPAQFPAIVPGVLSVSAVGKLGEFPEDTRHGLTAIPDLVGSGGIFATNFSGMGPQIGVCAPGVAVISSVPGGGFAARDGTATAAAHIAGFAALVLAHHPLFRGASRNEQRVNALFGLIRSSAMSPIFDPARVGAGLPNLQRVPGLGAADVENWNEAVQGFGAIAATKEGIGEWPPAGFLRADLASAMAFIQLRANGLI